MPQAIETDSSPRTLRKLKLALWGVSIIYIAASVIVPALYGNMGIPEDAMADFVKSFRAMAIAAFSVGLFVR